MENSQGRNDNQIKNLIDNALGSIKNYVDMDTLIGDPLEMGADVKAYPIIKVTVGIVAGGEPIGFLVVNKGKQELITIQNENAWADAISKVGDGLSSYLKNVTKKQNKEKKE